LIGRVRRRLLILCLIGGMAAVVTPKPLLAVQFSSGFIDIADGCTGVGCIDGEKTFVISKSAPVSGVQTQLGDTATVVNGTLAAFAAPATIVIGSCTVSGDLGCGHTSGTIGSSLQLGDPGLGLNAQTRFFRHTATVVVPAMTAPLAVPIPEPRYVDTNSNR